MMSNKKQFNLYLDEDLIKAIKHAAIEADMRLSDYVAEALAAHINIRKRVSDRMAQILAGKTAGENDQ